MDTTPFAPKKPHWLSIQQAAEYLDVGEPTLYRWMREGKITYRKVGDSTRFLVEDLDAVVQIYRSEKDVQEVHVFCPACHHPELVEGHVQSTGLCYFRPKQTKFWTLQQANVETTARMCPRCGLVSWFGDRAKLAALKVASGGEQPTRDRKQAAEDATPGAQGG